MELYTILTYQILELRAFCKEYYEYLLAHV